MGHSLGGGEAALNSLATSSKELPGRKAITFNAAGLSYITKLTTEKKETTVSKIDAYIMLTDPLNIVQYGSCLPNVNGSIHLLMPADVSSFFNGHSINSVIKSLK